MLKKFFMLGIGPLAIIAVATSASANPRCSDLSNSGMSDEQIAAQCSDTPPPERFFAGIYQWFSQVVYTYWATDIEKHPD